MFFILWRPNDEALWLHKSVRKKKTICEDFEKFKTSKIEIMITANYMEKIESKYAHA